MTVSISCILNLKIRNGFLSSVTIKIYADRTFFAYANGLMRLALQQRFIQTTLYKASLQQCANIWCQYCITQFASIEAESTVPT